MYPVISPVGTSKSPKDTTYWTPREIEDNIDKLGDDERPGIGCFHDSWRIIDATFEEAGEYLAIERSMAEAIAVLAQDEAPP